MKMLKVALVVLVMAAMVTPVIAEDRLSLNGEMRVRGWFIDNDNADDDTATYGDQRLRIGGKIAVAEGVSITFRTDITESRWGSGNANGSGRTSVNGSNFQSQHWDRAHIDLTKGNFHLRAGQQYKAYGKTYAVDVQSNGLSADYKFGDVPVNVFAMLIDENAKAAIANCSVDQRKTYTDAAGVKVANPQYGVQSCSGDANPYLAADTAGTKACPQQPRTETNNGMEAMPCCRSHRRSRHLR